MSLDYDLRQVPDRENLDPGLTEAIIFSTMIIGIGEITEADAPQFYYRLRAYEKVAGTITRNADGTDRPTTPADVKRYIGLRTNVSRETEAKFKSKLFAWATEDARDEWRKLINIL